MIALTHKHHQTKRFLTEYPPSTGRPTGAFTLIELLVVITIIGILAGLLLPVVSKVTTNARKVEARSTELQIVTAIKNYQTEYGMYPVPPNTVNQDVTYGESSPTTATLMDVLRADGLSLDSASGGNLNPRGIVYFEMAPAKNLSKPKSGIGSDGFPYDPWGRTYFLTVDSNYDNSVVNPYTANAGFNPLSLGVIVWSFGPDGKSNAGSGSADKNVGTQMDDVLSWQ